MNVKKKEILSCFPPRYIVLDCYLKCVLLDAGFTNLPFKNL